MKRRLLDLLACASLVLSFSLAAIWLLAAASADCASLGCKTTAGTGYRLYVSGGQFVFITTTDLMGFSNGPNQGLFPKPQGFFSWSADVVPVATAPDFGLRTVCGDVLYGVLAEFGFQGGGYYPVWEYSGPIGGFPGPPIPRTEMNSYAVPFSFPILLLLILPVSWLVEHHRNRHVGH